MKTVERILQLAAAIVVIERLVGPWFNEVEAHWGFLVALVSAAFIGRGLVLIFRDACFWIGRALGLALEDIHRKLDKLDDSIRQLAGESLRR
jgi:hypothetical protein